MYRKDFDAPRGEREAEDVFSENEPIFLMLKLQEAVRISI